MKICHVSQWCTVTGCAVGMSLPGVSVAWAAGPAVALGAGGATVGVGAAIIEAPWVHCQKPSTHHQEHSGSQWR